MDINREVKCHILPWRTGPPQMEEAIIAVDEIVKMIKEDHEAQEKNTR